MGDYLYNQAVFLIKEIVKETIEDCKSFADRNNYEFEWVIDRFRTEFNKEVKRALEEE